MENAGNSDRSSDNGLLELSCASSSFDEGAFPSNSACKNSEVELFRFEPYESNPPSEWWDFDDAESEKANRLLKYDWYVNRILGNKNIIIERKWNGVYFIQIDGPPPPTHVFTYTVYNMSSSSRICF